MRLIGTLDDEKSAYQLYTFLTKEGVPNTYELSINPENRKEQFKIWVIEEDDFDKASALLEAYKQNPADPKFAPVEEEGPPAAAAAAEMMPPPTPSQKLSWKMKVDIQPASQRAKAMLTKFLIGLCAILFLWDNYQLAMMKKEKGPVALEIGITPLLQNLLFDYTRAAQAVQAFVASYPLKEVPELKDLPPDALQELQRADQIPSWKGFYDWILHGRSQGNTSGQVILFEKIRQGEVWRLFTPCLLHQDFLHILFNMFWLWLLGKQMENRIGKLRLACFVVIAALISNLAQYMMSGPYFLGFSGVVVGMAAFIWMRQKAAPWEGYPLQRGTAIFLFVFVVAMFVLELITFLLQATSVIQIAPNIANTAHVVGGLVGFGLAKVPFFARKIS